MKILGVIPARYQSSRLPGKPLVNIYGMPMIERVYRQCLKSNLLFKVIVATDDKRIFDFCQSKKINVCLTSTKHQSGTERCAEVLGTQNETIDYLINIQGDEPFINPQQIDDLANLLKHNNTDIATLAHPSTNWNEVKKQSNVKVVVDANGRALYFSRSVIPFSLNKKDDYLLHIGLYGFNCYVLKKLVKLKKSTLEVKESLEQLRWLENGYNIRVGLSSHPNYSIDTPKDLENLPAWISAEGIKID